MGPQSRDAAPATASAARRTTRRRHGGLPGWRPVLVRGCAGLLLLPALLVGLPLELLYGTLVLARGGGPFAGGGLDALLSAPDQGQLLVWVLAAIGWLAWAAFALGILVELAARISGRLPRRIPALGWSQRCAAALLGAVFALLPAGGALAATSRRSPRQRRRRSRRPGRKPGPGTRLVGPRPPPPKPPTPSTPCSPSARPRHCGPSPGPGSAAETAGRRSPGSTRAG